LSYKSAPKISTFCDSLEPNKHWSKRLRFGEEFPAENPTYGVLPTGTMTKIQLLVAQPSPNQRTSITVYSNSIYKA